MSRKVSPALRASAAALLAKCVIMGLSFPVLSGDARPGWLQRGLWLVISAASTGERLGGHETLSPLGRLCPLPSCGCGAGPGGEAVAKVLAGRLQPQSRGGRGRGTSASATARRAFYQNRHHPLQSVETVRVRGACLQTTDSREGNRDKNPTVGF